MHLILTATLGGRCYCIHFKGDETEPCWVKWKSSEPTVLQLPNQDFVHCIRTPPQKHCIFLNSSFPEVYVSSYYFWKEVLKQFSVMPGIVFTAPSSPSFPLSGPYLLLWIKPHHLSSVAALSLLTGEVTCHDSAVSIFPCFDFLGFQHQLMLFWVLPRMGRLGKQQSGLLALQVVDSIWLSLFIHEFFLCCKLRRFACLKDSSLF